MNFSSLLLTGICIITALGCSKREVEIEGTYDVSIIWRADSNEGVIFNQTYTIKGNNLTATDEKNEFQMSNFSEQLIPSSYSLNREFNTTVNGVGIAVGNISGSSDNGLVFPFERMLTFYEPHNQPRIEVYLSIQENQVDPVALRQ